MVASGLGAFPVAGQEYHVDSNADNLVRFISRATIEEFEGITERIDGYVVLGEDGLALGSTEGSAFYLEVDLASIDTGISLRNRHMRDNYLETDRYPYATFAGAFDQIEAMPDGSFRVVGSGRMGIHGVTRERSIPCHVVPSGRRLRVRCAFQVLLSDHDIDIPRVMFLKLANEIRLELGFHMRPAEGAGH